MLFVKPRMRTLFIFTLILFTISIRVKGRVYVYPNSVNMAMTEDQVRVYYCHSDLANGSVSWLYPNGSEIVQQNAGHRIQLWTRQDNLVILRFNNSIKADSGEYRCVEKDAFNKVSDVDSIMLHVILPTQIYCDQPKINEKDLYFINCWILHDTEVELQFGWFFEDSLDLATVPQLVKIESNHNLMLVLKNQTSTDTKRFARVVWNVLTFLNTTQIRDGKYRLLVDTIHPLYSDEKVMEFDILSPTKTIDFDFDKDD